MITNNLQLTNICELTLIISQQTHQHVACTKFKTSPCVREKKKEFNVLNNFIKKK